MSNPIMTYTGAVVRPLDMEPQDLRVVDIAHSLAYQCRYNGHTSEFYSVAQHAYILSDYVESEDLKLSALLHDTAEAYIGDMPYPVKEEIPEYEEIENQILRAAEERFDTQLVPLPDEVESVDRRIMGTEMASLFSDGFEFQKEWPYRREMLDVDITPWNPKVAKRMFLKQYEALNGYDARRVS